MAVIKTIRCLSVSAERVSEWNTKISIVVNTPNVLVQTNDCYHWERSSTHREIISNHLQLTLRTSQTDVMSKEHNSRYETSYLEEAHVIDERARS
jgi:hypothetical protein